MMPPSPEPRHNYLARKVEDHSRDIPLAERLALAYRIVFGRPTCRRGGSADIKRRMRGEDWELSL